jgi:hypothetical protein
MIFAPTFWPILRVFQNSLGLIMFWDSKIFFPPMDFEEEKANEIEALKSIFYDEFRRKISINALLIVSSVER